MIEWSSLSELEFYTQFYTANFDCNLYSHTGVELYMQVYNSIKHYSSWTDRDFCLFNEIVVAELVLFK